MSGPSEGGYSKDTLPLQPRDVAAIQKYGHDPGKSAPSGSKSGKRSSVKTFSTFGSGASAPSTLSQVPGGGGGGGGNKRLSKRSDASQATYTASEYSLASSGTRQSQRGPSNPPVPSSSGKKKNSKASKGSRGTPSSSGKKNSKASKGSRGSRRSTSSKRRSNARKSPSKAPNKLISVPSAKASSGAPPPSSSGKSAGLIGEDTRLSSAFPEFTESDKKSALKAGDRPQSVQLKALLVPDSNKAAGGASGGGGSRRSAPPTRAEKVFSINSDMSAPPSAFPNKFPEVRPRSISSISARLRQTDLSVLLRESGDVAPATTDKAKAKNLNHSCTVTALAWAPPAARYKGSPYILTADYGLDKSKKLRTVIYLWDAKKYSLIKRVRHAQLGTGEIVDFGFSGPSGKFFTTTVFTPKTGSGGLLGTYDRFVWRGETLAGIVKVPGRGIKRRFPEGLHGTHATSMDWTDDENALVCAVDVDKISVYSMSTKDCMNTLELDSKKPYQSFVAAKFLPPKSRGGDQLIVAVCELVSIQMWNYETGEVFGVFECPSATIGLFPNNGPWLTSGGIDGQVKMWDIKTATLQKTLKVGFCVNELINDTPSVVVSPTGKQILVVSASGSCLLWNIDSSPGPIMATAGYVISTYESGGNPLTASKAVDAPPVPSNEENMGGAGEKTQEFRRDRAEQLAAALRDPVKAECQRGYLPLEENIKSAAYSQNGAIVITEDLEDFQLNPDHNVSGQEADPMSDLRTGYCAVRVWDAKSGKLIETYPEAYSTRAPTMCDVSDDGKSIALIHHRVVALYPLPDPPSARVAAFEPSKANMTRVHTQQLALAVARDEVHMAADMLKSHQHLNINRPTRDGELLLSLATRLGHLKSAKALLRAGADPNAVGIDGLTAMHIAALYGQRSIMGLLLDHGGDVNAVSPRPDLETPLMLAAEVGNTPVVEWLLKSGAKANHRSGEGRTALHYAAEGQASLVLCQALISAGCRGDAPDAMGTSPLDLHPELSGLTSARRPSPKKR